jgi:TP901 family phage tail tape measure protein
MAQPGDDLTLAMRLYADASRFVIGLQPAERALGKFVSGARGELEQLKASLSGVKGTLAGIGVTFGATAAVLQSARLDRDLDQIALAAGAGIEKTVGLRVEIFRLARETGRPVQEITQGFANLVSSGMDWNEALQTIQATTKASSVTGVPGTEFTPVLATAADAYKIDLSKPQAALTLLDKITVSARLGNAEMDNMAQIFSVVGQRAANVKMSDTQTLGLISALSRIERRPRQLTSIADSTLEFFNNLPMMAQAQSATGVQFFRNGTQRNPLDVLKDLRAEYAKLRTDADKKIFMRMAFTGMDSSTQLVLGQLLSGKALDNVNNFSKQIANAGGTLDRDLGSALDNSVDQADRLKNELQDAADGFAKPINAAISGAIKFGLDSKDKGGLGLTGGQIAVGGTLITAGTLLAARYGGKAFGALARSIGGTAAGLAEGKLLEKAAGVTPVFVVNMPNGGPGGGMPGLPGLPGGIIGNPIGGIVRGGRVAAGLAGAMPLGDFLALGPGAMATAGLGVLGSAGAGYGIGSLISHYLLTDQGPLGSKWGDKIDQGIGEGIAKVLAFFGDKTAADADAQRQGFDQQQKGELHVVVEDSRTSVKRFQSPFKNMDMNIDHGKNVGVFG